MQAEPLWRPLRNEDSQRFVLLLIPYAALWALVRPYRGMWGDAEIYTLQALATLHPQELAGDIFLRYGSQTDFTLFPSLYALLGGYIGFEAAASVIVLACSITWLVLGWLIARTLVGARLAWLSVGLLIAVRAQYAHVGLLQVGELYLSARLPAEVTCMAAILAALNQRFWVSTALFTLAATMHPLMTAPAALLVALLRCEEWLRRPIAPVAIGLLCLAGIVANSLLAHGGGSDWSTWMAILRTRSSFLFPDQWRLVDWQLSVLSLATLAYVICITESPLVRRAARIAALIGATGLVLALIAGESTTSDLLLRLQTWRWMWIAQALAIILLPASLAHGASAATPRAHFSSMLLFCAWLMNDSVGGLLAMAALVLASTGRRFEGAYDRAFRVGSFGVATVVLIGVALSSAQAATASFDTGLDSIWIQRLRDVFGLTAPPILFATACWHLANTRTPWPISLPALACSLVLALLIAPTAFRSWTERSYSQATFEAFKPWRDIIPGDAEVLWHEDPLGVWLLLQRRNFLSGHQLAGLLYSPDMTPEYVRRADALRPLADPGWWAMADESTAAQPKKIDAIVLSGICKAPDLDFVVSTDDAGGRVASAWVSESGVWVNLYDCRAVRRRGST